MRATQGFEYQEYNSWVRGRSRCLGGISLKTSCHSPGTIRIIVHKIVEEDTSLKR